MSRVLVLLCYTIQGETQSELALTKQSVLIVVDNITSVFAEKLQQPETFLEIVPAVIVYVVRLNYIKLVIGLCPFKLHKTCPRRIYNNLKHFLKLCQLLLCMLSV